MNQLLQIRYDDIKSMDKVFRLNLINGITGYKPANLIGTKSKKGILNLSIISSLVHLGSNPPILGFILRPTTVPRHTYSNIKETNVFTINHVHSDFVDKAHYSSAKFDEEISEFKECNLTELFREEFYAPFVKESKLQIAMEFLEEYHIKANDTRMIVGLVKSIYLPENIIKKDGQVDLNKINNVAISGLNNYHSVSQIRSFSYARPGQFPVNNL